MLQTQQPLNLNFSNLQSHKNLAPNKACIIAVLVLAISAISIGSLFLGTFAASQTVNQARFLSQEKYKDVSKIKNQDLSLNLNNHKLGEDHIHESFILSYAALGMPVIGRPFDIEPICYEQYYQYEMNQDELFRPYLETNCEHERFGSLAGAGFILCKNFLGNSEALLNYGMKKGDQFGCSIARSYPLTNYVTTCNGEKPTACDQQSQKKTVASQNCLSQIVQFNREYSFTTLKEQIDSKKLQKRNVVIKMDIGGAEWMALKTLPIQYLQYIDQMVIVFHNPTYPEVSEPSKGKISIIDNLKEHFYSVNLHMDNNHCIHDYQGSRHMRKYRSSGLEVTLVNKKLITLYSSSRGYLHTHSKNQINNIARFDCQMKPNQ